MLHARYGVPASASPVVPSGRGSAMSRRASAVAVGVVVAFLVAIVLAVPLRDDYSETGPDPGVRRVSLLSNLLDRAVDDLTVALSVVIGGGAGLLSAVVVSSLLQLHSAGGWMDDELGIQRKPGSWWNRSLTSALPSCTPVGDPARP